MTPSETMISLLSGDPAESLAQVWTSKLSLGERARIIAALHMRSRMTLEGTARMTGASPGEIQALLELATLDDDDLEKVSNANPPSTTWVLFANADSDAIDAGLDVLKNQHSSSGSLLVAVYEAMKGVAGPDTLDRVANLASDVIWHLRKKAIEYGVLSKSSRNFLASAATRRRKGLSLTEKQAPWMHQILVELIAAGVVSRESVDDDQETCNAVFDTLGT